MCEDEVVWWGDVISLHSPMYRLKEGVIRSLYCSACCRKCVVRAGGRKGSFGCHSHVCLHPRQEPLFSLPVVSLPLNRYPHGTNGAGASSVGNAWFASGIRIEIPTVPKFMEKVGTELPSGGSLSDA